MSVSVSSVLVSFRPWLDKILFDDEALAHTILESGAQPLTNADDTIILAVNGEIYNHRQIRKHLKEPYHFKTQSDCEVIIPLVSIWSSAQHQSCVRES